MLHNAQCAVHGIPTVGTKNLYVILLSCFLALGMGIQDGFGHFRMVRAYKMVLVILGWYLMSRSITRHFMVLVFLSVSKKNSP